MYSNIYAYTMQFIVPSAVVALAVSLQFAAAWLVVSVVSYPALLEQDFNLKLATRLTM